MPRWEEVVDQQLDTVRYWHSDMGKEFAKGYTASVLREVRSSSEGAQRAARSMYNNLDTRMASMLEKAEPVWVDPDMWTIIEAAHRTFEPEPLLEQDLITEAGFLVLPKSIELVDVRGSKVAYRAFAWHPMNYSLENSMREGILLAMYTDTHEKDDYYVPGQEKLTPFLLSHLTAWIYNEAYPADDVAAGLYTIAKWVQSMWRLMSQTIVTQSQETPPRSTRKRLQRANFPEKKITVIRLRRPKYVPKDDESISDIEWTHRWLVAGHWRNQWYKKLGEHRQIWISPYIKGPEDLPLIIREKRVFTLVQ